MSPQLVEAVAAIARHCWRGAHWVKRPSGPVCIKAPLTKQHLEHHLNAGPPVGLVPIVPGESATRIALYDFDSHKGEMEWPFMVKIALNVRHEAIVRGLEPIPFRSSGGKGIHLVFLWDDPQDAYSVRELLRTILTTCNLKSGVKGVRCGEAEIFPKQNAVAADKFGSMFVLPLSGESVPLDPVSFDVQSVDTAEGVTWPHSGAVAKLEAPPAAPRAEPGMDAGDDSELGQLLANVPNRDLDYDAWRNVIFAIHHATGGSDEGKELAHAWSAQSSKHNAQFLDERVWPYVKDDRANPITLDSLRALARASENVLDDFEAYDDGPIEQHARAGVPGSSEPATDTGSAASRFPPIHQSVFVLRPRPEWIIPAVVPENDLMVMYGESGSGKSFFAFDLGATIACGVPWRGREVHGGPVLYVCAEGAGGFRNRLRAYHQRNTGRDAMPFWIIDGRPNFMDKKDALEVNKAALEVAHSDGVAVKLIIIDTLAQVMPGGNENTSEDMGKVLVNCDALRRATHATVMLIHHSGKDLTKGARGWSGVKGAIGQEIEITRSNGARVAAITKAKDGEDGAQYGFTLGNEAWEEQDGSVTTSCVVVAGERVATRDTRPAPSPAEQAILDKVRALIEFDLSYTELTAIVTSMRAHQKRPEKHVERDIEQLILKGWLLVENNMVTLK